MIDISRLPEEQKEIAKVIGAEAYEALVKKFGGGYIYISALKKLERHKLTLQLRKEYNGDNAAELGKRYGISARTVMRIITKRD